MKQKTSQGHLPDTTTRWAFDESVTECFDDMLSRSIPLYTQTLDLIAELAMPHIRSGDTILDLGVSCGQAIQRIINNLEKKNIKNVRIVGIDNSDSMLVEAKDRLPASCELIKHDLRTGLPYRAVACEPSVILCLWTAQFIPLEYRSSLFNEARECVTKRGCMFIAEKLNGQTWLHQKAMIRCYHDWKEKQGFTKDEIDAKATSLEGVLVSHTAPNIKAALLNEGWTPEEVIRYLGFAAWYCLPIGQNKKGGA